MKFKLVTPGFGYGELPEVNSLPVVSETVKRSTVMGDFERTTHYVEITTLEELMELVKEQHEVAVSWNAITIGIERIY